MSAARVAELHARGDANALTAELIRARGIAFYLAGLIEGLADLHRDAVPAAVEARRLVNREGR